MSVVVVALLPLTAIEVLYRVGLGHVDLPPQPVATRPLGRFERALWAHLEGDASIGASFQWPWTAARNFRPPARGATRAVGATLANEAARVLMHESVQRHERMLWWHLANFSAATWFSRNTDAETLLGWYADHAYFGRESHNLETAASAYFAKSTDDLEWAEVALLVGELQSPSRTRPECEPDAALKRRNFVLRELRLARLISPEEADVSSAAPLLTVPRLCDHKHPSRAP